MSIIYFFRLQLGALVEVLQSTTPWYVRCIKPNMEKQHNFYDNSLVLDQLKYLGMLEIIRIRREGYPVHFPFPDFVTRFKILGKYRTYPPKKEITKDILQSFKFPVTEWQLGHNKVFLRGKVYEVLEENRLAVLNSKATKIQAIWKGFRVRKNYTGRLRAVLIIQAFYRTWKVRLQYIRKRKAAIIIQSHLRGMFAREVAAALREMRRVEEAMRKQEEYINKRKSIIQQQSENGSIEDGSIDSSAEAKEELDKLAKELSEMQSNSGSGGKENGFENLFCFLTEAQDHDAAAAAEIHRIITSTVKNHHGNQTPSENLESLGSQMDLLVANLEDELESQATNTTTNTNNRGSRNLSSLGSEFEDDITEEGESDNHPPALPPPGESSLICPPPPPLALSTIPPMNKFGKCQPTLPEPNVPPPPIPPGVIGMNANNKSVSGGQVNLMMKPTLTAAMAKQQALQLNRQNQLNNSSMTSTQAIINKPLQQKPQDIKSAEVLKKNAGNGNGMNEFTYFYYLQIQSNYTHIPCLLLKTFQKYEQQNIEQKF